MMIAIAPPQWSCFWKMNYIQLAAVLKYLANFVRLNAFRRHSREPKKSQPQRTRLKN